MKRRVRARTRARIVESSEKKTQKVGVGKLFVLIRAPRGLMPSSLFAKFTQELYQQLQEKQQPEAILIA